jgi:hypothetical protein
MPTYNPGAAFRKSSPWNPARKHPKTGKIQPHRGEDWAAPEGTAIPAAADGSVVYKGWLNGYGNLVVLEHTINGDTVHTLYGHMNVASPLEPGAKIKKGETVGTVGMTGGVSTGNHLHFEVMPGGTPGSPNLRAGHSTVDPQTFDFPGEGGAAAPAKSESQGGPWAYPFKPGGGDEVQDSGLYLGVPGGQEGALARVETGFYPIGTNSLWHGGIHFDNNTDTVLDQRKGVRCIRDGEVVAYLVDSKYHEVEFPGGNKASYSTGFTLIRHKLEIPAEDPAKRKALVFYSLYMHLLDMQGYSADAKRARPPYWGPAKRYRVGDKAKDEQEAGPAPIAPLHGEFEGVCGWEGDC